MTFSEVSARYAAALFELASEAGNQQKVIEELRAISELFSSDAQIRELVKTPLVKAVDKEKIFKEAMVKSGASELVKTFITLLAKKNRLEVFSEVVNAFQFLTDETHGVKRGIVKSATVLDPGERQKIEETVEKYTNKRVILTYKEDPNLIGGLVAQVGSYTFDDTLTSHLKRLKDELNRRAH